ncbi:MAG: hypothetical protein KDA85_18240 [Planctomycetaceae bacterium]|nr:hypothetical protein [Planctomycetaceae bacterium]
MDSEQDKDRMDCIAQTTAHIRCVQSLLLTVCNDLMLRAIRHDASKLQNPEFATFVEFTPKLRDSTYGSDEYKGFLASMKPALDHHYANNSHHPEHFENGVQDMTLLDLLEMLLDWKAATERHADGDIFKSIEINRKRFNMPPEIGDLLLRTAESLFPKFLEPWHCYGCGASGCRYNFCYQCGAGRNDYVKQ